jgi:hypothetical protein
MSKSRVYFYSLVAKIISFSTIRFELKPDFWSVISALPAFDQKQTLFAYEEVGHRVK